MTDPTEGTVDLGGLRLAWGGATDVGQLREVNQDSMLVRHPLFVVADGMGGHAAGEVASKVTVDTIGRRLGDTGRDLRVLDLVTAVQAANDEVWDQSASDPALAGMGTTVVALAPVVEDGEQRLAIVNVGDSRAYRLSEGELRQISDDHSLVGELVREGRLTSEEAATHPRKNIVTRAIGIEDTVEVDEFEILPRTGDRYLLCSDGLTDEVTEADIAHVLRTVERPEAAAAELVERANASGGRDNITVVVVDVVADGLDLVGAGAAVPDDADFSSHPDQDTQSHDPITGPVDPVPAGAASATSAAGDPTIVPDAGDGTGTDDAGSTRAPRAITLRSLAFILAVLAAVGIGGFLGYNAVRNTYYVGIENDEVAIFRGRPDGFLWFDPTFEEGTGIDVDDVPGDVLDDLQAGATRPSLASARRYVANLEERIEELTPPVTTTTEPTPTTAVGQDVEQEPATVTTVP